MPSMVDVDPVYRDVAYAVRGFVRARLLATSIMATLLIGIGINGAIFSVVNGTMFRSRTSKDAASFVQVLTASTQNRDGHTENWKASVPLFERLRQARLFSSVEAWGVVHTTIQEDPRDHLAMLVTCGFFALYGEPEEAMGRALKPADCAAGAPPVAVIGEQLWRREFGSDPHVTEREVLFNRHAYTIVGVASAGFEGRLRGAGIWIPYTKHPAFFSGEDLGAREDARWLTVEGRLTPGATRVGLLQELSVLAGEKYELTLTNGSVIQHPSSRVTAKWVAPLLLGAFGLILMLACTNVTMLLLSRAVERQKEMAVRLSVGASRAQLVRMLCIEGLTIAAVAGLLSAWVCSGVPALFERLIWRAPHYTVTPDWTVFGYLAGITLASGCVTGLAPAWESLKADLTPALKGSPGRFRVRDILIGAQVATSLVLLIGAALFMKAESTMIRADSSFEAQHTLVALWKGPVPAGLLEKAAGVRGVQWVRIDPTVKVGVLPGTTPLAVRFAGDADEVARSLSTFMLSINAHQTNVPFLLSAQLAEMASRFSSTETLVVLLGVLALALALVGIYGVVGFSVVRRTKELGIRLALGALTKDIVACVVGPGMRPVLAGIGLGLAVAAVGSLALEKAFQNAPIAFRAFDAVPYLVTPVLLSIAALGAMLGPALRAAYRMPGDALRND